nr:hypothetical protein [Candidatus Freyarchaeota archaeon]
MTILKEPGDAIEGEKVKCQYRGPAKLKPNRIPAASGHRVWRITLDGAYCEIEKKYRWLGD